MLKLWAVSPYGVNDRLGDNVSKMIYEFHVLVTNKLPLLLRKYNMSLVAFLQKQYKYLFLREFLIKIKHNLNHNCQTSLTFLEYIF